MKNKLHFGLLAVMFSLLSCAGAVIGQCPVVTLKGPATPPGVNEQFKVKYEYTGGDDNVSYISNWEATPGRVIAGQGMSTATIDTAGVPANTPIEVRVELGGSAVGCTRYTTIVVARSSAARKIDSYAGLDKKAEEERLAKFVVQWYMDKTNAMYLVGYSGKKGKPADADKALARAKAYLISVHMDPAIITTVNGGEHDAASMELWLAPPGVTPPVEQ